MPTAIAYIDGFNLFKGIEEAGLASCNWLDLQKLSQYFLAPMGFEVPLVKYFTLRIPDHDRLSIDQKVWLKAIELQPAVQTFWGDFRERRCGLCKEGKSFYTEKGTDVKLAVNVVADYFYGIKDERVGRRRPQPDAVLIISGDSDLVPILFPIKSHSSSFPLLIAFPPRRASRHLQVAAGRGNSFQIQESALLQCTLPDVVTAYVRKPATWT